METISFKVTAETRGRLAALAASRGETVSRLVATVIGRELDEVGRGALLDAGKEWRRETSTYDPSEPAFDEGDWEINQ